MSKHPDRAETLTLLSASDNSIGNHLPDIEMIWRVLGSGMTGDDLESVKKEICF
ncbi:MAG TPA: hypothetical protein PL048_20570 [Leptospiraceae bacterium]|nr:hypothetical protein [Leptospiraceae bacterium]HMY68684.1 hypothetical protein [Leptospiraceae bacterium]HMZ61182.1 hypothetical protein [Leptospiraceae bacterium]HNF14110.1 hypothetical protein [Leptospiraceae bacterium]HNF27255.1 hypothetical protein [Leptospiraceae bacterium]